MGVPELAMATFLLLLAWAKRPELLPWGLAPAALIAFVDYAVVSAAGARSITTDARLAAAFNSRISAADGR